MSINAKIEYQLESALVTVISASSKFAGTAVRRHTLASSAPVYPIITVYCDGAQDAPFTQLQDYQEAIVSLSVYTYAATDTTGEAAANLLGELRSLVYAPGFKNSLTAAEAGLTVWGVRANGPAIIEDDEDLRRRVLVLTVYASSVVVTDESSSSSSSTS